MWTFDEVINIIHSVLHEEADSQAVQVTSQSGNLRVFFLRQDAIFFRGMHARGPPENARRMRFF